MAWVNSCETGLAFIGNGLTRRMKTWIGEGRVSDLILYIGKEDRYEYCIW